MGQFNTLYHLKTWNKPGNNITSGKRGIETSLINKSLSISVNRGDPGELSHKES